MRIRLTIAAVLAVFAISAPLASAESTGVPGAVAGVVTIEHITESGTNPVVLITVSQNACLEHLDRGDTAETKCSEVALAPPGELDPGPPGELEPGPPLGRGRPCDKEICAG